MKKANNSNLSDAQRKMRPGLTPESREDQCIALAMNLAEKQLRDGTASSQLITEFVKRGSPKEKTERDILEKQKELIEAKTQSIQSAKKVEELYANALNAMRRYSGHNEPDNDC